MCQLELKRGRYGLWKLVREILLGIAILHLEITKISHSPCYFFGDLLAKGETYHTKKIACYKLGTKKERKRALHQKREFGTVWKRFNGLGTDGLGTVMRSNFLFSVPNPLIRSKNRKLERFWNGLTD